MLIIFRILLFIPIQIGKLFFLWVMPLALIAAVLIAINFDLNEYKKKIEEQALAELGITLKINGNIGLAIRKTGPSILVDKVTIGDKTNEEETILYAKRIEINAPISNLRDYEEKTVIGLKIDSLKVDDIEIGNLSIPVLIDNKENLLFENITGRVFGGNLLANISYGKNNRLDVKAKLKKLDLASFEENTKGTVDIEINVTAHGKTGEFLLKTLDGTASIIGGKATLPGNIIEIWATSILTTMLPDGGDDKTAVNCMVARFDINNGLVTTKAFLLDTKDVTVMAKGTINLTNEDLKLQLKPKPKDPSLLNLATPINIRGKWSNPSVTPDAKAVAGKVGGLLLGIVNPAALLIPLVKLGGGNKNRCIDALDDKKEKKAKVTEFQE